MRFTTITLMAMLAAITQAQSIPDLVGQIPTCAFNCLTTAITAAGCGIADYVCQCTTGHDAILANGAGCISSACSTSDTLATTDVTNKICALATVGGAGTSSAQAANSATSAAASAASSAANAASSIASVVSSAASAASASATAAASASASASASAAASASGATKASTSPSATATTSSGNSLMIGANILGAALVAALAL